MPTTNKPSDLPTLPVFEGLTQWGDTRLRPEHRENTLYLELRRQGTEEWKPLFAFVAINGRIAFRLMAEKAERMVVYDPTTHTFADVDRSSSLRDNPTLQRREVGKDDNRGGDNAGSETNPRDGGR
jgi:hypothetical protein